MSIKNIAVGFNGKHSAVTALKYAASLAGDGAHVTALLAHSTSELVDGGSSWVPETVREIVAQADAEFVAKIEARLEDLRGSLGLGDRLHFQSVSGGVDAVLSECARSYDMLIVGQEIVDGAGQPGALHPDRIALMSGRPLLIVPQDYEADAVHANAVIAWDGRRAAARALSDSLALLQAHGEVTVLTIGDEELPRPVSDVMQHLDRHGVNAAHDHIDAEPGTARALLSYCEEHNPSLLVMGAYEHSKFREDFFGGVTARVLSGAPIPVLLSH